MTRKPVPPLITAASPASRSRSPRVIFIALLLVGAGGILYRSSTAGDAEQLSEDLFPFVYGAELGTSGQVGTKFFARDGRFYKLQTSRTGSDSVLTISEKNIGTPETQQFRHSFPNQTIFQMNIIDNKLVVETRMQNEKNRVQIVPGKFPYTLPFARKFAAPTVPNNTAGETRIRKALGEPWWPLATIYRCAWGKADLPASPDPPSPLVHAAHRSDQTVAQSGIYVREDQAGYEDWVANKTQCYMEYPPRSRLWFTGRDGSSRIVAQGLTAESWVAIRDNVLFWMSPRVFPAKEKDLFSLPENAPAGVSPVLCRNAPQTALPDVIFAGRFYWVDYPQTRALWREDTPGTQNASVGIVSTASDGSLRRTLMPSIDHEGYIVICRALFASQGKLYARYAVYEAEHISKAMQQDGYHLSPVGQALGEYVARIYPEQDEEHLLGRPVALPIDSSKGFANGNYFYCVARQKSGPTSLSVVNTVADLFSAKSTTQSRITAYRVALPQ